MTRRHERLQVVSLHEEHGVSELRVLGKCREIVGAAAGGAVAWAKGCAVALAVLGPSVADALGVELTAGGGEFQRTHGWKE